MKEAYKFLESLDTKTREKVLENIRIARFKRDPKLFKKIDSEIWEFRTQFAKHQIRLFAFWDKTDNQNTLVISTHGLIKKTNKIPNKEIEKAKRLRTNYFSKKN